MSETPDTVISAQNLAAGYKSLAVWSDANFSIKRGQFIGVLGPNGAGKTTLFRLLLGLSVPLSGTVSILGASPKRGNPRIGYVPQRHIVDGDMQIEALEFVRLGLSGNKWGVPMNSTDERAKAMEALRAVSGEELAHRAIGRLSGGELQRVFLAEALVSEPDILLLDEPLANLDIRREMDLVHLVDSVVRSRGVTALLIAHNINPLLAVLDTAMYIAGGRIVVGKPEEVITSKALSELYGTQVEVLRDSRGRVAILGVEDADHHHHE